MSTIYSTGILALGEEIIKEQFKKLLRYSTNIISVNSDNGKIEKYLQEQLSVKIICVSDNHVVISEENKTPCYSDVNQIPEAYKENCILFINWSKNDVNCDMNYIKYFNPLFVIVILDTGYLTTIGSSSLHNWISKSGIYTFGIDLSLDLTFNTYNLITDIYTQIHLNDDPTYVTLGILSRDKLKIEITNKEVKTSDEYLNKDFKNRKHKLDCLINEMVILKQEMEMEQQKIKKIKDDLEITNNILINETDIEIIVDQTGCTIEMAIKTFKNNNGNLIDSILSLSV